MNSITFVVVGQTGDLNSTVSSGNPANYPVGVSGVSFLANDAAIVSAWANIFSAGTFVDGNGNVQQPSQATFWKNTQLDTNGNWASGDIDTSQTNSGVYLFTEPDESVTGLNITGNLVVGGTTSGTGAATFGSTVGITGAASLGSTLAVTGNVAVNTNKFTVTAASGNTLVAGTLAVTGVTTLSASLLKSNAHGLTALAGGAQAGTALAKDINQFTTVASADDSAQLPVSVAGMSITVINATTTEMKVFGQTGDTINALAANTGLAVAAGATTIFTCPVAGAWYAK